MFLPTRFDISLPKSQKIKKRKRKDTCTKRERERAHMDPETFSEGRGLKNVIVCLPRGCLLCDLKDIRIFQGGVPPGPRKIYAERETHTERQRDSDF